MFQTKQRPYLSKRYLSYKVFPGIDWTDNITKVENWAYKNTDGLLAAMAYMTEHISRPFGSNHGTKYKYPVSNTIFVQKGFGIRPEYVEKFKLCLKVNVTEIDFFDSSVVEDLAKQLSLGPTLLSIANSSDEKKTVLLSRLDFSQELEKPFNRKDSTIETFTTNFLPDNHGNEPEYIVNTTMLNQKGYFKICNFPNATAIASRL